MAKIKYNLKNVYYALIEEEDENGIPTYATPVRWPGAVELTMDKLEETTEFHADGYVYFTNHSNNGYSGTFESALVPEGFRTDALGEIKDATTGVVYEVANAKQKRFALLFEFDSDINGFRHVLYDCLAGRPSVSSATTTTSIAPSTETVDMTARPRKDNELVKASAEGGAAAFEEWFTKVHEPAEGVLDAA